MLWAVTTASRPTAADALHLGRRRFLRGERIDMSRLADELGVNRVTLYRWYGSRDQFLVELIWSLARDTLDIADRNAKARGPNRVVRVLSRFLEDVISN